MYIIKARILPASPIACDQFNGVISQHVCASFVHPTIVSIKRSYTLFCYLLCKAYNRLLQKKIYVNISTCNFVIYLFVFAVINPSLQAFLNVNVERYSKRA